MLHTTLSGDGPTLVWAHGLMHSTEFESRTGWFHPVQPDPLRRVRFDARGHGRSPGSIDPADYLWSSQAGDLLSLADAQATGLYALGGHSMGSASALLAALRAPEKVSCLVLATPPTAWHTRPAQVRRYRQMQRIIQQRGLGWQHKTPPCPPGCSRPGPGTPRRRWTHWHRCTPTTCWRY